MIELNKVYNYKFEDLLVNNILIRDMYEKVNLICIDPPYEINYDNNDFQDVFDFGESAKLNKQLLTNNGTCLVFAGWSKVRDIISIYEKLGFKLMNWIIWDRMKGRGAKYNFVSTREDLLWFVLDENNYTFHRTFSAIKKKTKGMGAKNGSEFRVVSNVWTDISPVAPMSKEKVDYSCQKPIKLYERILNVFSNQNDLCIDYTCGSGGFGVACQNLKRNFIINDKNIKAYDLSKMRLERGY